MTRCRFYMRRVRNCRILGRLIASLAATYAHLGRLDEAQDMIARLQAVSPAMVARDAASWRNPEDRELFLSGLRLAAGETT
jgi:hypothetical protein